MNYCPWNVTVFPSANVTIRVLLLKLQLKIIFLSSSPTQALLVLRSIFATLVKSDFKAICPRSLMLSLSAPAATLIPSLSVLKDTNFDFSLSLNTVAMPRL